MTKSTRRTFLKVAGAGIPALMASSRIKSYAAPNANDLNLAIASYSFRNYSLHDAIMMTKQLAIKNIALKSMHLPLETPDEEIKLVRKMIQDNGLNLYGAGVIYMNSEDEVYNAFRYAKAAMLDVIIGVPKYDLLDLTEQQVKEHNIKLAIHNHGPGDNVYPSPETVYNHLKSRDRRMGLCMDIGHTKRLGLEPAVEAAKYMDRLLDVHAKDVDKASGDAETIEIGRGIIDIPAFLSVLLKNNYQGMVSFEFEKDPDNIMPGISESIGYTKGVLDVLKNQ